MTKRKKTRQQGRAAGQKRTRDKLSFTITPEQDEDGYEVLSPLSTRDLNALEKESWISAKIAKGACIRRIGDTDGRLAFRRRRSNCAGLVLPYWWPGEQNKQIGVRLRRDGKRDPRYLSRTGQPNRLYLYPHTDPRLLKATKVPVVITEGEKKTLALHRLAHWNRNGSGPRFLPVGLGGVWNWRGKRLEDGEELEKGEPIPDLDRISWSGRTVHIIFDADTGSNENVQAAREALSSELESRGAEVHSVTLPEDAGPKGVDDFLAHKQWGPKKVLDLIENLDWTAEARVPWPEPEALGTDLPAVMPFAPKLLPRSLRAKVKDEAERIGTSIDFAAVAEVTALAGSVGRRAFMQPLSKDGTWKVFPCLWSMIVGPPGSKKSPVIDAVLKPQREIESAWWAEHEQEVARWKDNGEVAPKPQPKQLILNDATMEAAHKVHSANKYGLFLCRDELSGWLRQLDKQGREGERQFFLQAHNGNGFYSMERIGRGHVRVDGLCISMLGGIQEDLLKGLVDSMGTNGGIYNDGFFQRFQLLCWPDFASRPLIDRKPNTRAINSVKRIHERLLNELPNVGRCGWRTGPLSVG